MDAYEKGLKSIGRKTDPNQEEGGRGGETNEYLAVNHRELKEPYDGTRLGFEGKSH